MVGDKLTDEELETFDDATGLVRSGWARKAMKRAAAEIRERRDLIAALLLANGELETCNAELRAANVRLNDECAMMSQAWADKKQEFEDLGAAVERVRDDNARLKIALRSIATYEQDERPGPNEIRPFDWRRRSMKQEDMARSAAKHTAEPAKVS